MTLPEHPTPLPRDSLGAGGVPTPRSRKPFRAKAITAVTFVAVLLRMVRNLFVHGRPFPPPFVFKEPPE